MCWATDKQKGGIDSDLSKSQISKIRLLDQGLMSNYHPSDKMTLKLRQTIQQRLETKLNLFVLPLSVEWPGRKAPPGKPAIKKPTILKGQGEVVPTEMKAALAASLKDDPEGTQPISRDSFKRGPVIVVPKKSLERTWDKMFK